MANYEETSRTNYFRVTDEKRYQELFKNLTPNDEIYDLTKTDENGVVWHAFGSFTCIDYEYEKNKYDRDIFFVEMQEILPDDEALIFMSSGYEKLRYVTGLSVIVTNNDIRYVDIISNAIVKARAMLNNPGWTTEVDY